MIIKIYAIHQNSLELLRIPFISIFNLLTWLNRQKGREYTSVGYTHNPPPSPNKKGFFSLHCNLHSKSWSNQLILFGPELF